MMRGPTSRHRPCCTLGEPSRARRPARWVGGGAEAGRPPPLSRFPPLRANHQAGAPPPARPPVAPQPLNAKFSRENQSSWQRSGQWWPSGRSGSHARLRRVLATHAALCHPQKGQSASRRVDRERSGRLGCQPGQGADGGRRLDSAHPAP